MLSNAAVNQRIVDMSCAQETQVLDRFFEALALTEDKVTYGPKSVQKALREMAVETLLISDKLFRSKDIEKRKFYVNMHDHALRDGLKVVVFGSTSAAGTRLNDLTGVAAILRFEMQCDDTESEDEGDLDSEEEEGEIGASTYAENSDVASSKQAASNSDAGSIRGSQLAAGGTTMSGFDEEEKKSEDGDSGDHGGWDQQYLEDVFGAVDEIDADDDLALEQLGEMEYRRQMSGKD
mmetsp:Transcript_27667/g.36936  ORF Transcript_27667/g.36936 Transcript_27667/m.36936 type:complete len:236 (+) Transcript_27667:784-1491(+)